MKIKTNEIKSENIPEAIEEILATHPGVGFETAEIAATHIVTLDEDWTDEPEAPAYECEPEDCCERCGRIMDPNETRCHCPETLEDEKALIKKALADHGYTDLSYTLSTLDEIEKAVKWSGIMSLTTILDDGRSIEVYGGTEKTLVHIYEPQTECMHNSCQAWEKLSHYKNIPQASTSKCPVCGEKMWFVGNRCCQCDRNPETCPNL